MGTISLKTFTPADMQVLHNLVLRFRSEALDGSQVDGLSSEEFGTLRKMYPQFGVLLVVASLVKAHPIPIPETMLLKKANVPGFTWELPYARIQEDDRTFEEAVARIGRETIGASVQLHSIIGTRADTMEDFGLICLASLKRLSRKHESLERFRVAKFPWGAVVPDHKTFINSYCCQQIQKLVRLRRPKSD